MRKSLWFIIVSILIFTSGCTQNNGYIGPIFGSWSLVDISEDGQSLPLETETVFSFQNEIVEVIKLVNSPYEVYLRFGNFTLSEDVLVMKFSMSPTSDGNSTYVRPDWLYFPEDMNPLVFDVVRLKGSEMKLRLHNGDKTLTYSFRKTW